MHVTCTHALCTCTTAERRTCRHGLEAGSRGGRVLRPEDRHHGVRRPQAQVPVCYRATRLPAPHPLRPAGATPNCTCPPASPHPSPLPSFTIACISTCTCTKSAQPQCTVPQPAPSRRFSSSVHMSDDALMHTAAQPLRSTPGSCCIWHQEECIRPTVTVAVRWRCKNSPRLSQRVCTAVSERGASAAVSPRHASRSEPACIGSAAQSRHTRAQRRLCTSATLQQHTAISPHREPATNALVAADLPHMII